MKNKKGITLLTLIVTIIILLVLAGVTMSAIVGDNGIIKKAKKAKMETEAAAKQEETDLDNYSKVMDEYLSDSEEVGLPENTEWTVAGTRVKTPEEWRKETVRHLATENGLEITEVTKVATVYAVAVGGGESVPVPYGFYYVGGDLGTGVIISDNEEDKYDGGLTDKTSWEYTRELKGNQFVWIPCSNDDYFKTSFGLQNANWDNTTPKSEKMQIEKYGGFYVGRYEAGLAEEIEEYTEDQISNGTNTPFNKDGIPQSKAGKIPWMFINWIQSKKNSESMYNNSYVSSGLITGMQWDVMLNRMVEKTELTEGDLKSSSKWGIYKDTSINFKGRMAKAYNSSSGFWYITQFGEEIEGKTTNYVTANNGDLLTTGASSYTERYHIFDIAGNVWEWTEEVSKYQTSGQYHVLRSGSFINNFSATPACYRSGNAPDSNVSFDIRFSCGTLYKIKNEC